MRLFCVKCDKEIKDFELIRTEHSECGFSYHTIGIRCHGDKSIQGVSSRNKRFNTSDYGDFYFFKKDSVKNGIGVVVSKEWNEEWEARLSESSWIDINTLKPEMFKNVFVYGICGKLNVLPDFYKARRWSGSLPYLEECWSWLTTQDYIVKGVKYWIPIPKLPIKGSKGEWAGPIPEPIEVKERRSCCDRWRDEIICYTDYIRGLSGKHLIRNKPTYCPGCGRKL